MRVSPAPVLDSSLSSRVVEAGGSVGVDDRHGGVDVAVALVVGARAPYQIEEDWNSLQAKIPAEFWSELQQQHLIEADASLPAA